MELLIREESLVTVLNCHIYGLYILRPEPGVPTSVRIMGTGTTG